MPGHETEAKSRKEKGEASLAYDKFNSFKFGMISKISSKSSQVERRFFARFNDLSSGYTTSH